MSCSYTCLLFLFSHDTPTVEIYTLSLHDALPICFRCRWRRAIAAVDQARIWSFREAALGLSMAMKGDAKSLSFVEEDRKSTRLNSSHTVISYAVFCLKKKKRETEASMTKEAQALP